MVFSSNRVSTQDMHFDAQNELKCARLPLITTLHSTGSGLAWQVCVSSAGLSWNICYSHPRSCKLWLCEFNIVQHTAQHSWVDQRWHLCNQAQWKECRCSALKFKRAGDCERALFLTLQDAGYLHPSVSWHMSLSQNPHLDEMFIKYHFKKLHWQNIYLILNRHVCNFQLQFLHFLENVLHPFMLSRGAFQNKICPDWICNYLKEK